ncbi:MAG: chromosomal replication initiator protein DnaA [Clostridia bacterium]|nr:chromosomal replication initiator protein DnaA [Clostridia bacterium]
MNSFIDAWEQVAQYCQRNLTETAYSAFVKGLTPVDLVDNVATFSVRTQFQKEIIENHYLTLITAGFKEVFGFVPVFNIVAREEQQPVRVDANGVHVIPNRTPLSGPFNETIGVAHKYTFDTFVVGQSNKFPYSMCKAVASKPGAEYNPLFLYGPSGLGKTHLLFAIRNKMYSENPSLNIIYVKGDDFLNEFVDSLKPDGSITPSEFREKYRKAHVLLMDDVQFVSGKEALQVELFHTFETLYQAGRQIVFASDRPPKEIKALDERLRNRFEWGVFADISFPDLETRIAIVERKAQQIGFDMPQDITKYIAEKLNKNIRQLDGAVTKIKAYTELTGEKATVAIAQTAIRDVLNDDQPLPVTIEQIITEVSRTFGVSSEDIVSKKRSGNISLARQVAIFAIRDITQMSLVDIGKEVGGRNYATMIYSLDEVSKRMEKDSRFKAQVTDIIKNIRDK